MITATALALTSLCSSRGKKDKPLFQRKSLSLTACFGPDDEGKISPNRSNPPVSSPRVSSPPPANCSKIELVDSTNFNVFLHQ